MNDKTASFGQFHRWKTWETEESVGRFSNWPFPTKEKQKLQKLTNVSSFLIFPKIRLKKYNFREKFSFFSLIFCIDSSLAARVHLWMLMNPVRFGLLTCVTMSDQIGCFPSSGICRCYLSQVKLLRQLKHDNIISIFDMSIESCSRRKCDVSWLP